MLKLNKRCKVCIEAGKNPKLLKDIYKTAAFLKSSDQSLLSFHADYIKAHGPCFTYEALLNHSKRHQFLSEKDLSQRHLRQIAKDAEKSILKRAIESRQVWDEVIDQGMEKLQAGELHMKTGDLLKAAKDKSDFEFKQKDQQLAVAQMVWHFASGENNREDSKPYDRRIIEGAEVTDFDPAVDAAGDADRRENESRAFYKSLAGDASSPRAD